MRSAEDVYKILTSQKTNFVIIEESICNELSLDKGCRIKDLLDISNGHVSLHAYSETLWERYEYSNFLRKIPFHSMPFYICKSSVNMLWLVHIVTVRHKSNPNLLRYFD